MRPEEAGCVVVFEGARSAMPDARLVSHLVLIYSSRLHEQGREVWRWIVYRHKGRSVWFYIGALFLGPAARRPKVRVVRAPRAPSESLSLSCPTFATGCPHGQTRPLHHPARREWPRPEPVLPRASPSPAMASAPAPQLDLAKCLQGNQQLMCVYHPHILSAPMLIAPELGRSPTMPSATPKPPPRASRCATS